jgi:hypothetical protein
MAARASSFLTVVGSKLALALPDEVAALEGPVSEALVHAERARALMAIMVAAVSLEVPRRVRGVCISYLLLQGL